MLRATLVYTFVGLFVVIVGPVAIVWTLLRRESAFIYRASRFCMRIAGWMCGLKVKVRGREKLSPGQHYQFLSNHQANFDGPIMTCIAGRDLRAVVKKEMMSLPVLSIVFRQVGYVPIDRTDPASARAGIDEAARRLRSGMSFFAFPEGTRSRDGRLGPFKKGVFIMALKAGAPVVPVSIRNTMSIQPPGAYAIRPGTVEITFHDPIPTDRLTYEDRDWLIEETRGAIEAGLTESVPPLPAYAEVTSR